jgi:hypothetical protein
MRKWVKFSRKKEDNLSADNIVLSADSPKCYQLITLNVNKNKSQVKGSLFVKCGDFILTYLKSNNIHEVLAYRDLQLNCPLGPELQSPQPYEEFGAVDSPSPTQVQESRDSTSDFGQMYRP